MNERDADRLVRFARRFAVETRGELAGKLIPWRDWQIDTLRRIVESRARIAYVQLPRKNGKSALGSVVALFGLIADNEPGAEVYSVASSRDQARIVFDTARRMVEMHPALAKRVKVYRNELVYPPLGARYKALAAEAGAHEGLNPSLVVFDEVHALGSRRELWDVMRLGMGTRRSPLLLAITTPGVMYGRDGRQSLAHELYEYSRRIAAGELEDPDFMAAVWEAAQGCDVEDEAEWGSANPALGDFLSMDDMRAAVKSTPENEFRTKRLGQWVASHTAWIPTGAWSACDVEAAPRPGAPIVLGFDGSKSRDATALIGATIDPEPALFVVGVWERPRMAPLGWQVPRAEVEATLAQAMETWDVREIVADPTLWVSELQAWSARGWPVVEYPQSPSRMVPATQRFYEAVTGGTMVHDGDPVLERHVAASIIRPNGQIGKDHKDSPRKVDAAVAAIMAYERACQGAREAPMPRLFVV